MDNFSKDKNTSNFSKTQREAFEKKAKSPSDLLTLLDKETGRETAEFTIEHKALVDHFGLENYSIDTIRATGSELARQKKKQIEEELAIKEAEKEPKTDLENENSNKTQSTKGVEERGR